MQIVDKYGYLEDVLNYIEKNIICAKHFEKLSKKARLSEYLLKKLSKDLQGFSEKYFLTSLQDKLEERHSSLAGAEAEVFLADVGIEVEKSKAFVLICLNWDVVIDEEKEDKITTIVKIFSKNNIQIKIAS